MSHSVTTVGATKMAPKRKGVGAVEMKRTKVSRVAAESRAGAAALQVSEHEHALAHSAELERIAVMRAVRAMNRQKRLEQDKTISELAMEREAFGPLGFMCEPQGVSWEWDMAKRLYNFIRDSVESRLNFPGHMLVFQSVVDAQKALVKADPDEEEWTLWEVCLALEHRGSNATELWSRGVQEMKYMISEWRDESYDVDCSPVFMFLQSVCDEDPNEQTPMCFDTWKTNDPVQTTMFSRMYVQHVSEHDDKEVAREWELRHDIKKALHALKTIAQL